MTPDVVARVDAWLASRRGQHLWLVNDWKKACRLWKYRRSKDPDDTSGAVASAEAAMRGILLALVREAWADKSGSVTPESGRRSRGKWACIAQAPGATCGRMFIASSEDDALATALEAAPRREGA